jgi:hypothetical protein
MNTTTSSAPPTTPTETLSDDIARLVLLGPSALPLLTLSGPDAALATWLMRSGPSAFAELWRECEDQLRQFARAHRLVMPAGYPREFFGEGIAKQCRERDEYATCVHESAHGCVALANGVPVREIRLTADGGFATFGDETGAPTSEEQAVAEFRAMREPKVVGPLIGQLVATLAGHIAHMRVARPPHCAGWYDQLTAERLVATLIGEPPTAARTRDMIESLSLVARSAVSDNWGWIVRVARRLQQRRTLSGADIEGLRGQS